MTDFPVSLGGCDCKRIRCLLRLFSLSIAYICSNSNPAEKLISNTSVHLPDLEVESFSHFFIVFTVRRVKRRPGLWQLLWPLVISVLIAPEPSWKYCNLMNMSTPNPIHSHKTFQVKKSNSLSWTFNLKTSAGFFFFFSNLNKLCNTF